MANEIKRIEKEFILKNVLEQRTPLEVHVGAERLQAFVEKMNEERLWLRLADDSLSGRPAPRSPVSFVSATTP